MPLSSNEHQQVKAATKERRNAGAKRARSSRVDRFHDVSLLEATWTSGERVLLAFTAADGDRPFVLHEVDGRWHCSCFQARYSVKRTCSHMEAAAARAARTESP